METGEIIFEKRTFDRGKALIASIDRETKRRKIRWKMDISHNEEYKRVFLANWARKKIKLIFQEERGYLSLIVSLPNDEAETYNADTDPSLNSLFVRVEHLYQRKMKKFGIKKLVVKV